MAKAAIDWGKLRKATAAGFGVAEIARLLNVSENGLRQAVRRELQLSMSEYRKAVAAKRHGGAPSPLHPGLDLRDGDRICDPVRRPETLT